jgi:hypothetical protein
MTLALQPGINVTGRLSFDASGGTTPPDVGSVRIMMVSVAVAETAITGGLGPGANLSMTTPNPDGTFSFQGLAPGRYVMSAAGAGIVSAWMQKAVMVAGQNVYEGGLEIRPGGDLADIDVVLTDRSSEVSGTLLDAAGRPAPEYYVFVFPVDKTAWTQLSPRLRPPARPASDGRYSVTRLLPGEYFVAALTSFDSANLYDTAFLEQVAAAAFRITLAEGEKKVQDLRIK